MPLPKAMVVVSNATHTLLRSTFAELAEGLRDLGHEVTFTVFADKDDYAAVCRMVRERQASGDDFFVVDGNCKLSLPGAGQGLRRFSYVTDAPWSQFENIAAFQGDATISFVDRSHSAFYADIPCGMPTVFLPHGGPLAARSDAEPRDIDLLFVGNLSAPCRMEHFRDEISGLQDPLPQAFGIALDLIIEEGVDPYAALKGGLTAMGLDPRQLAPSGMVNGLRFLAGFAESHNRWRLLTSVRGARITLAGLVDSRFFDRLPETIDYVGVADEGGVIDLMRRAKILLNSVTVFPDGAHERLWYGLAHGAAIATDRSRFVEETLTLGQHLLAVDEVIETGGASLLPWLGEEAARRAMVDAARAIYSRHHTWRHRARIIHEAMGG